jgi:glycosyltransferase involved in cell wall biosynthesis
MQRALLSCGVRSEIFAINEHPKLKGTSRKYTEVLSEVGADLVMHYSLGSPLNEIYRNWKGGGRSLIYHNITPSAWYGSINARVAEDIEQGLSELPQLCGLSDQCIADSPFNAQELLQLGISSQVLYLPVDPRRWDSPRNEGIYSLVKGSSGIHVLHVGRLAPNKCVEDVIKCFYFLRHFVGKSPGVGSPPTPCTLWLVGIDTDTELYSFSLRRLAAELSLEEDVRFVGCMADEEVRALYEACSVYVCMSEHEGFCLPLVEAMHFGLPVLAFSAGAVPDTVGSGGVLVKEKRHAELAELIAEMATAGPLRESLIKAGRERVSTFSYERFASRVKELLVDSHPYKMQAHG